jgi:hypothetical protein
MSVKKEAAYHEAAHVVLAYKSMFHSIVEEVNLRNYGEGETFVSLSASKCKANGKPQDPSAAKDKEVAKDLAVILCGGFIGEKIAASFHADLCPNSDCAATDYHLAKQSLSGANTSKKLECYAESAASILKENWSLVEELADFLFENVKVDAADLIYKIKNSDRS